MAQPITESEVNPAAHWRYAVQYGHTMLGYEDWVRERALDDLREAVREYGVFQDERANLSEADGDEREVYYLYAIRDAAMELVQ